MPLKVIHPSDDPATWRLEKKCSKCERELAEDEIPCAESFTDFNHGFLYCQECWKVLHPFITCSCGRHLPEEYEWAFCPYCGRRTKVSEEDQHG